jgi:ArsR family transcriptional regulator, arsenate/arsenite/antimonite-responsive transcriptional repressor
MKEKMAEYFKVLSDSNRLKIIELLLKGETCGCTLIDQLPISQPTLSYHLNMIATSGLAHTKRDGNRIDHFINRDQIDIIIDFLNELKNLEAKECSL